MALTMDVVSVNCHHDTSVTFMFYAFPLDAATDDTYDLHITVTLLVKTSLKFEVSNPI